MNSLASEGNVTLRNCSALNTADIALLVKDSATLPGTEGIKLTLDHFSLENVGHVCPRVPTHTECRIQKGFIQSP